MRYIADCLYDIFLDRIRMGNLLVDFRQGMQDMADRLADCIEGIAGFYHNFSLLAVDQGGLVH